MQAEATEQLEKPRRRRKRNRRGELLAIAARLFAQNGFAATTMTQISEEAGILSGSLYHHFETKEAILHELMRSFGDELVQGYREAAMQDGSAEQVLTGLLTFAFEQLHTAHDRHMIMYNERKFIRLNPEFRYIADYGREINRIVYAILQQGVREGSIRDDINLELAAQMILRLTNVMLDSFQPGGRFDLDEILQLQITLLLEGLRKH